jgi:hypothetical protein
LACVAGRCTSPDGASPALDGATSDATGDAPTDTASGDAADGANGDAADGANGDAADGAPGTDATTDSGGSSDATVDDGSNPPGEGGSSAAEGGGADANGGDAAIADASSAGDGSDDASLQCPPGEQVCASGCADLTSDPFNCGVCDNACPSQICSNSQCVGATPGGLVFIGHDYRSTPSNTAQARVLANSVWLGPPRGPSLSDVEILSYERYADPAALNHIQAILAAHTPAGRTLHVTSTQTDADVAALSFATYSVLLVPDQTNAQGDVDLGALGTTWAAALSTFTHAGGIVIVLDGGTGAAQMPALVSGTGLLTITAQAPLATGTPVDVWAPGDAVGVGVLSPYAAGTNSVTVTTEANAGSVVYVVGPPTDAALSPIVVHKVF